MILQIPHQHGKMVHKIFNEFSNEIADFSPRNNCLPFLPLDCKLFCYYHCPARWTGIDGHCRRRRRWSHQHRRRQYQPHPSPPEKRTLVTVCAKLTRHRRRYRKTNLYVRRRRRQTCYYCLLLMLTVGYSGGDDLSCRRYSYLVGYYY